MYFVLFFCFCFFIIIIIILIQGINLEYRIITNQSITKSITGVFSHVQLFWLSHKLIFHRRCEKFQFRLIRRCKADNFRLSGYCIMCSFRWIWFVSVLLLRDAIVAYFAKAFYNWQIFYLADLRVKENTILKLSHFETTILLPHYEYHNLNAVNVSMLSYLNKEGKADKRVRGEET